MFICQQKKRSQNAFYQMKKKETRYARIEKQIIDLIRDVKNPLSRMATITALLHHKIDYFYWTGFYLLSDDELEVACYQGPLACMRLKKGTGVCWSSLTQDKTICVDDVEQFPGHIACSALSKSEIVVPLRKNGQVIGCLDIDSRAPGSFDATDQASLERIVDLIYSE